MIAKNSSMTSQGTHLELNRLLFQKTFLLKNELFSLKDFFFRLHMYLTLNTTVSLPGFSST